MGITTEEYIEKRAQEILDSRQKAAAKDQLIDHSNKSVSAEDEQLAKDFFLALASKSEVKRDDVNARVTKQFEVRQKAGQTEGTIGTGTAGGVLVPTTVADSILEQLIYISPIRQIARVISNMPAQLELPNEQSIVTATWQGEAVAPSVTNEVFAPNVLTPYKLTGLDTFTVELLQDAATNPDIRTMVENRFAVAIALAENTAFVNGTGSGQPFGFRSSQITPAAVPQSGATLAYTDVSKLLYTMKTGYRQNGAFLVSSAGLQALMNIKDTQGRPIWIDSFSGLSQGATGAKGNVVGYVLGRPVYLIDEIPSNLGAGTNLTEIWYIVPDRYIIGDRMGLQIDYGTNGTDFAAGQISLRVIKRVAGMPVDSSAFVKLTGVLSA